MPRSGMPTAGSSISLRPYSEHGRSYSRSIRVLASSNRAGRQYDTARHTNSIQQPSSLSRWTCSLPEQVPRAFCFAQMLMRRRSGATSGARRVVHHGLYEKDGNLRNPRDQGSYGLTVLTRICQVVKSADSGFESDYNTKAASARRSLCTARDVDLRISCQVVNQPLDSPWQRARAWCRVCHCQCSSWLCSRAQDR